MLSGKNPGIYYFAARQAFFMNPFCDLLIISEENLSRGDMTWRSLMAPFLLVESNGGIPRATRLEITRRRNANLYLWGTKDVISDASVAELKKLTKGKIYRVMSVLSGGGVVVEGDEGSNYLDGYSYPETEPEEPAHAGEDQHDTGSHWEETGVAGESAANKEQTDETEAWSETLTGEEDVWPEPVTGENEEIMEPGGVVDPVYAEESPVGPELDFAETIGVDTDEEEVPGDEKFIQLPASAELIEHAQEPEKADEIAVPEDISLEEPAEKGRSKRIIVWTLP